MEEWEQVDKPLRDLIEIIHFTENVSARIHGVMDETEIYRTVKKEFAHSKRCTASILALTDDGSNLRIVETSMPARQLEAAEKPTGLRLRKYKIDLNKSNIYSQVVREGKTVQVNVSDILDEQFPQPLARLISEIMGYGKRSAILTPLKRYGKVVGVLAMTSTELADHFIPSVRNLARHISTALELADEYAERKRAEEALRESELQYRTTLDSMGDAIHVVDTDLRFILFNTAFRQWNKDLGLGTNVIGRTVFEVFPFLPDKVRDEYHQVFNTGEILINEGSTQVGDKDFITETRKIPIYEEGRVVRVITIVRDITERKRAEEALRESEERFRALYEDNPSMYFTVDAQGMVLSVNPFGAGQLGYTVEELVGQSVLKVFYPDDQKAVQQQLTACLQNPRQVARWEFRKVRKDGSLLWVREAARAMRGVDGNPIVLVVCEDITERKQAEQELQETNELLRVIIEVAPLAIIGLDLDGRVQMVWNPAAERMLGWSAQEVIGSFLPGVPVESQEEFSRFRERIRSGKTLDGVEVRRQKRDGSPIDYSIYASPLRDAEGQIIGNIAILVDITERKKMEQALRQMHDELEERVEQRTRELKRANEQLAALYKVGQTITAPLQLRVVLDVITRSTAELLGTDTGVILLVDEAGEALTIQGAYGLSEKVVKGTRDWIGESIAGRVVQAGQPIIANDLPNDPRFYNPSAAQEGLLACASVPLVVGEKIIGTLDVHSKTNRYAFTEEHIQTLNMVASQAAIAIENARLYEQAQQAAILRERQRMARDLHDSVTQLLYSLTLLSEAGQRMAKAGELQQVEENQARLSEIAQQALQEMRLMVYELRPLPLKREGLVRTLEQRLEAVERRAGVDTHLVIEGEVDLTADVEEEIYRIAQEALNNSLKHARASVVTVTIRAERGYVALEVTDNGRGFDPEAVSDKRGLGLVTMQERAEKLGGRLTVRSVPGGGTSVKLTTFPNDSKDSPSHP
jgi:PAS domain S-box-containing protein